MGAFSQRNVPPPDPNDTPGVFGQLGLGSYLLILLGIGVTLFCAACTVLYFIAVFSRAG